MIKSILVPVDGSTQAGAAAEMAGEIAERFGAAITLLHVMTRVGTATVPKELRAFNEMEHVHMTERDVLQSAANEILELAERKVRQKGIQDAQTVMLWGDPAQTIVAYAREHGTDLIVMGRRGLGDLKGLLMGSVSHKVGHFAKCPCLTVT